MGPLGFPYVRPYLVFTGDIGDFFHISHTHPLGGVDVPFEGYEL